ncbi:hypothetical protein CBS101457_001724 [Exobasidium rhododendri]|nr:hypothetical protein CBS101457_001724 [Exobasidium rhododendri]
MASDPTYTPNPSAMRTMDPLPCPTLDSLISVLFQATSPDLTTLSLATAYLSDLEAHPTFWLLLVEIAFERNTRIEHQRLVQERVSLKVGGQISESETVQRWTSIRTVAIIRFKNGVDKYWRSRVINRVTITIPQDTKEQLRQGLFRCLDEPDKIIALQASVTIARIARQDFPNSWPSLFTTLQEAMVQAHAGLTTGEGQATGSTTLDRNRLILLRASDICQKTLKELATVRILAGKIRMTELSRLLLPTLVPMLQQYFTETFTDSSTDWQRWSNSPFLTQRIRTSHLLLKSVTYLAVADMGTLSRNSSVAGGLASNLAQEFFRTTPTMLQLIRDARLAYIHSLQVSEKTSGEDSQATLTALQKHYTAFGKMYLALLLRDKSKAVAWPGWDEVVWWYWQQAKEATVDEYSMTSKSLGSSDTGTLQRHPSKFIVQSLNLLRQSLQDWKTTHSTPALFSNEDVIREAVDVLVGKFMLLSRDDLELWESDAEDWSVAEEADVYDVDVRPAAERTLMVLASTSKPDLFVGELLWAKFDGIGRTSVESTLEDTIRRDAIYAAVGRCRDQLPYSREALSKVTSQRLILEAALEVGSGPFLPILRRRIAWLIWEWSEHMMPEDRPAIYHLLVSLLEDVPGKTDAAVRLAAARSLAALADALEFDAEAFQPFIDVALTRLAKLAAASELHEMDSIKTCTNAMSILIERLGPRVAPHLQSLANLVPSLWMNEDVEFKAKPSVIVFVGKLVRSVELIPEGSKGSSDSLHSIVEVIVRDSLQPNNSALLGKDALELWIRALRSSIQMTEPLFRLLDLLGPLLGQPDFCPEACRVAQESTLMAPQQVMTQFGLTLMSEFAKIVGDPMSAMILYPITAIDIMMQSMNAQSVPPVDWATLLDESGLFYALLGTLIKVKDSSIVAGYYVALLARICYMTLETSFFLDLVQSAAYKLEGPNCQIKVQVIEPMIVQWCKRFENMASSRKRKITCLGLATLLAVSKIKDDAKVQEAVFDAIPMMVGVWIDMLGDLREDASGEPPPLPNAPPSSPLALNRSISQSELMRRSPSPALSIPGLEALDDDGDWLEDTSPGKARMLELNRLDPVNNVKLSNFVSASLNQAQQSNPEAFQSIFSTIDAVVVDILQKDLAR